VLPISGGWYEVEAYASPSSLSCENDVTFDCHVGIVFAAWRVA
jgi:hypothetical protein